MNFLKRLCIYFRVMFPLSNAIIMSLAVFFSFFFLHIAINGRVKLIYPDAWFALVTLFLFFILFRLNDELKDSDFDKKFNPDRPLVTGEVKYSDIKILIIILYFILIALNINRGFVTSVFLVLIIFLALSAQWFFFPKEVRKSFILTTITHQPILPISYFYIYSVYLQVTGDTANYWLAVPLFILFSVPMIAWEIARKTRAPKDETKNQTYSLRWGVKKATIIPMIYISITCTALVVIGLFFRFSVYYFAGNIALGLMVLIVFFRFLMHPESKRNHLKKAVEIFDLGFRVIIILEAVLRRVL